jgi:hypothetical protein
MISVPFATRDLMNETEAFSNLNACVRNAPVALADRDNDLAFAVLIFDQTAVAAVLYMNCWLQITTQMATINFSDFAFAARLRVLHFRRGGLAVFIGENPGRFGVNAQIACRAKLLYL